MSSVTWAIGVALAPPARWIAAAVGFAGVMIVVYPKLSAVRLFEEIRAAGYAGGYTQVKDCVRQMRPTPVVEPVVRFETAPGHQGQADFAEFRLPWGKRYALVVVLGYSRLLWLQCYTRQTMLVLMREREIGGRLLENAEFMRFAAHWDFRVRACRPYRAQTKGKVERPIGYVRQGFFYGRTFLNDADLNAQALSWLAQTAACIAPLPRRCACASNATSASCCGPWRRVRIGRWSRRPTRPSGRGRRNRRPCCTSSGARSPGMTD